MSKSFNLYPFLNLSDKIVNLFFLTAIVLANTLTFCIKLQNPSQTLKCLMEVNKTCVTESIDTYLYCSAPATIYVFYLCAVRETCAAIECKHPAHVEIRYMLYDLCVNIVLKIQDIIN